MTTTACAPREHAPTVLALGDSLTAGYGLPADQSFAAQLQGALRRSLAGAQVINAGRSGDTAAAGLARLPGVLAGLRVRPHLAIVELGANDLIRGVDPARTRDNLDAILHALRQAGIPPLLAGMLAPPFLGAHGERFNAVFADLARAHGVPLYPFFLAGVAGDPALTLRDGIHPNARAIGIVTERILPSVLAALRPLLSEAA